MGAAALPRVLRAQRLNADIDATLDQEDEARALRLWRPLARAYPDDRAVMHGYVLALGRRYGEGDDLALLDEFLPAAERLLLLDASAWEAASWAGTARLARGRVFGEGAMLRGAVAAFEEAERRAGKDRHARAMAIHGQAKALAFFDWDEATQRTRRALRLAPDTASWAFDAVW
ncbi:MAG TPA: hypothetical protein VM370_07585 [Candidatus Thermoplasmatota archaeon]|nr:hypothetical protein [Candidatus Thermoplasmatota archaeon]